MYTELLVLRSNISTANTEEKVVKFTYLASKAMFLCASLAAAFSLQATVCTQTGFIRDGKNLTAKLNNPSGHVSGEVDATGCNIGIYYGPGSTGKVKGALIHDADYYGVVNDGANVEIAFSSIHDIGQSKENFDQGFAIYLTEGSVATGSIHDNLIWDYSNGGIIVNGAGASINIANNIVTGKGPSTTQDRTGIQLGFGTTGTIQGNQVIGNSYSGPVGEFAQGIFVFGGPCYGPEIPLTQGVIISNNTLTGNDVGIQVDNGDASCNPSTMATSNKIIDNKIMKFQVTNVTGFSKSPALAYEAGVENSGDGDIIQSNLICGAGYTATAAQPDLFYIDLTRATNPVVSSNTTRASCPLF